MNLGTERTAILTIQALDLTRPKDLVYTASDPGTVDLRVLRPDGAVFVEVSYPGTIQRVTTGEYFYQYTPDVTGRWREEWTGTAPNGSGASVYFVDP